MVKKSSGFDKTLRPQDDFFGYVNNIWIRNNPIPPNESVWGTFYVLRDKSATAIKTIVDQISVTTDNLLTHDQQLIKLYFGTAFSCSDYKKSHLKTIDDELDKIKKIKNNSDLSFYLGRCHRLDLSPFWMPYVAIDDKNSQIKVLRLHQAGLSLPNRDYYLDNTSRMKGVRKKYFLYIKSVNGFMPQHVLKNLDVIINMESKLARISWTDVKLRNVEKNYTRFTITELKSKFQLFDWTEYFKGLGWKNPSDNIVINQPTFIDEVMHIINTSSLDEIKQYISWQVLNRLFCWIDESSSKIYFDFYEKTINGKKEINPLWKRAILQADNLVIGEKLGQEYSKQYFPDSSKQAVLDIVEDVRSAYHKRIDKVAWMRPDTKKRAHRKLDNIKVLIGYPSIWQNLEKLTFCDDNHLHNIMSAHSFESDVLTSKIGKKPPREEWEMNAHTVNAYHDPNQLVICFPAAILQPPFYDPDASYATNLGGIGAVIGHEFTHGFDDQGSEFDEFGNVTQWQTTAEKKLFKQRAKYIIRQANSFEVLPKIFLKGELVLGETIADIGGLELAVEALYARSTSQNKNKLLRELFENAAIVERGAQREESLVRLAKIDPHPPSIFRVNCVMPHINAFYKAYNVTPGDKLYLPPDKRVKIW